MKLKISELRKIIREEIVNENVALPASVQQAVTSLINAFPNVVTNQILANQGMGQADNRTKQAIAAQTKDQVDAAAQQFQQELMALVQKHLTSATQSIKPQQPVQTPQARPATGNAPDQRATMMPPAMA